MKRSATVSLVVLAASALVGGTSLVGSAHAASRESIKKGLTPTALVKDGGNAHSIKLTIAPPFTPKGLIGYKIYTMKGIPNRVSESTLNHLPSREPDRAQTKNVTHHITVTIHGLKTLKPYSFLVYGYDKDGNIGGDYAGGGWPVDAGFHITDDTFYQPKAGGASVAIDKTGREHLLISKTSPTSSGDDNVTLFYGTKPAKASKWNLHRVASSSNNSTGALTLETSTDGKRIQALVNGCQVTAASQTSISSTHLPPPFEIASLDSCDAQGNDSRVINDGVAVPNHKELLVGADISVNPRNAVTLTGAPGHAFDTADLPDGSAGQGVRVARDASNGRLTILGSDSSGLVTWDKKSGGDWSDPVTVADPPGSGGVLGASIASGDGKLYLSAVVNPGQRHSVNTTYFATRNKAGHWSSYTKLPHTGDDDSDVQLFYNAATKHLHATWTQDNPKDPTKNSGIVHTTLINGHWNKPTFLTHWGGDSVLSFAITKSGHPVVGYGRG